jgi:hypothetical protein
MFSISALAPSVTPMGLIPTFAAIGISGFIIYYFIILLFLFFF